jgi:hypothetical protein
MIGRYFGLRAAYTMLAWLIVCASFLYVPVCVVLFGPKSNGYKVSSGSEQHLAERISRNTSLTLKSPKPREVVHAQEVLALIFTMDSLSSYVERAARGGPSGELRIRLSLQQGLSILKIPFKVASSDAEFNSLFSAADLNFTHVFLDEWTVVDSNWKLRVNHPNVFVFAFFGASDHPSGLPAQRFLTAYPYDFSDNTFLGFISSCQTSLGPTRRSVGVLWGKQRSYFDGHEDLVESLRSHFPSLDLVVALAAGEPELHGVRNVGPLPAQEWNGLLRSAAFFMGFGHPLAGPSAVDAVEAGAVYIDPSFDQQTAGLQHFHSQHPYLRHRIGPPRVCAADLSDHSTVLACVRAALARQQSEEVPCALPDFHRARYLQRLQMVLRMH